MKTLIFILCLFLATLIGIGLNAFFTKNSASALLDLTASLPAPESSECEPAIEELLEFWNSRKNVLKLSVDLRRTDEIDDLINSLYVYSKHPNVSEFERVRLILKSRFEELSRFESPNPIN